MQLEEVDVISAQAAEALVKCAAQMSRGKILSAGGVEHPGFGSDHHALAHAPKGRPDDLLAVAEAVEIGRVEEVDSRLESDLECADGLRVVRRPVRNGAVGRTSQAPGAEADFRDPNAGRA